MIPRPFPESNMTLMPPDGMADCDLLSVFADGEQCVSCWQMSADELEEVNRNGGRVWVRVYSGHTAPPIALCIHSPFEAKR